MATVYSGFSSPYAEKAYIETSPLKDASNNNSNLWVFLNLDKLTIDLSQNGGFTYTSFTWTFLAPNLVFNNVQLLVDFLNTNFTGTGVEQFEWYIPGNSKTVNGVLIRDTMGSRIGVRTKNLVGKLAAIRINPTPANNTAIGLSKFNAPLGLFSRGDSGFTEVLPGPSPFDPFTALSVNLYEKGLMDRDFNILTSLRQFSSYSQNLRADSSNGTSITLSNIPTTIQYNGGAAKPITAFADGKPVVLTSANLGAAFAANTWYYVYNYWDVPTQTIKYEISATGPSAANPIYKNGNFSRRYMMCFVTDGTAAIIPFTRIGNRQLYATPQQILSNGNSDAVAVSVNTTAFVPPVSSMASVMSTFAVQSGALSFFFLFPGGRGNVVGQSSTWTGQSDTNSGRDNTFMFPILAGKIDYQVFNPADFLSLYIIGFQE